MRAFLGVLCLLFEKKLKYIKIVEAKKQDRIVASSMGIAFKAYIHEKTQI